MISASTVRAIATGSCPASSPRGLHFLFRGKRQNVTRDISKAQDYLDEAKERVFPEYIFDRLLDAVDELNRTVRQMSREVRRVRREIKKLDQR